MDFGENRGKVAAFFDLDGTLMPLPSLELRFFDNLRYRHAIPFRNYFFWFAEAFRLMPRGIDVVRRGNKMYLRGVPAEVQQGALPKADEEFFEEGVAQVVWHLRQGHAVVLITGTLEPLAREAARSLQAEIVARGVSASVHVCATQLETAHRKWTGRITGEAMFGPEKARSARKLAAAMQWDLAKCYAYGDSASDRWLLGIVGHPTAVNACEDLAQIARKHNWAMADWKSGRSSRRRRTNLENTRVEKAELIAQVPENERIEMDAAPCKKVESLG